MTAVASIRRRARRRARNSAGFSLIEVLVATALLSIALVPIAYVQSSGTRAGVASFQVTTASALAVELLARVRNVPYQDPRLNATSDYVAPAASLSAANPLGANGTTSSACANTSCGYTRIWKITSDTPIPNAKRIDVRVTWSEYGVPRSFILSTIKSVGS